MGFLEEFELDKEEEEGEEEGCEGRSLGRNGPLQVQRDSCDHLPCGSAGSLALAE